MNGFLDTVLFPLEWVVATIMVGFHTVLESIGMPAASGWTWALSIVGLVIVIRILLIPLFVKQINASRGLQLHPAGDAEDPEEVQGQDRSRLPSGHDAETMDLYKRDGHQPVQLVPADPAAVAVLLRPVPGAELAAGHLQRHRRPSGRSAALAAQAEQSTLLGAQLSCSFMGRPTSPSRSSRSC